jgi:excisionase family DNA binding protein
MPSALANKIREAVRAAIEEWRPVQSRLLTIKEAAEYLKISERTMKTLLAKGVIRKVPCGRRVMLDIRDLDQWIEDNKQ